ncbi:MAG TPA: hypothetical protein VFA23_06895 [Dongiaceae bacterium]|nr:hypothetical protein [Dongiaceae bacterium]
MWQVLGWAAWAASAVLILWMVWDFFLVNRGYGEDVLLSSREGVDELFADTGKSRGK